MAWGESASRLRGILDRPTLYYVLIFALGTGFFQSAYDLTYLQHISFHTDSQWWDFDWVSANLAQFIGIGLYGLATHKWPSRMTSIGTFRNMVLAAVFGAGATAASFGTATSYVMGGMFLATVGAITGFILTGIARHGSPRWFGRTISIGLGIGLILEFVTVQIAGAGNPSFSSWTLTALMPLGMLGLYSYGYNRVFFDIERGVKLPNVDERNIECEASFPNAFILAGATALMMLISLLGISRPRLVAPDLIDRLAYMQAFIIIGLAVVGPLMDRSRRAGAVATVTSLTIAFVAVAFIGLAEGADTWAEPITYSIGYLMLGSTISFAVIAFLDLASKNRSLIPFAVGGMAVHSVVEALVMGIPDSVVAHPAQSAILLAVLFGVMLPLSSTAKNRIWQPLIMAGRIVPAPDAATAQDGSLTAGTPALGDGNLANASQDKANETTRIPSTPEQRLHDFGARYGLSLRERELLLELLDGHSNSQIASRLYISESTVKFHVRNILEKTGCESRVEVINLYWRLEL